MKKCPHCQAELVDHDTFAPKTGGALHCFACGCCFLLDGKTLREGVPICALAQAPVAEAAVPAEPEPAPEEDEPEVEAPRRASTAKWPLLHLPLR
jgi:hypothetical protein